MLNQEYTAKLLNLEEYTAKTAQKVFQEIQTFAHVTYGETNR